VQCCETLISQGFRSIAATLIYSISHYNHAKLEAKQGIWETNCMNWKKYGVVCGLLLLTTGCAEEKSVAVSSLQFGSGKRWPLTVPEGKVTCVQYADNRPIVTFVTPNGTYALNGNAREKDYYRPIDSIHAPNPENPQAKKDLTELIAVGLELCGQK
jgi:hypothetical protein